MPALRLVPTAAVSVRLTPALDVPAAVLPLPDVGIPGSLRMVSVVPVDMLSLTFALLESDEPPLLQAAKITMAENASRLYCFITMLFSLLIPCK